MDNLYLELANVIFPNIEKDVSYYQNLYSKKRDNDKVVTRFAPSPTGFMHTGGLYTSIVNQSFAKQNNGTFYLRIEDTDQARKLENGVSEIIQTLKDFDIEFDEGPVSETLDEGDFGPYRQSLRKDIYQAYAKKLIEEGKAYPCFCTKEELEQIREQQVQSGSSIIGYAGKYAKYRDYPVEKAIEKIRNGESFVIRMKSPVTGSQRVVVEDIVRGKIETEDNYIDIVIIKGDGLPTYHFAHVIDDHLMGTTHVIRADEWLPSLPLHIQMFKMLNWQAPKYAHICPIMKMEDQSKRKLSKRKDPEARAGYYIEQGYPVVAVKEYLINLINSKFELWREKNPLVSYKEFDIKLDDMNKSGALFDIMKLNNISKRIIKNMSEENVFEEYKNWASKYDEEMYNFILKNENKFLSSISIWHKNRMDVAMWAEVKGLFNYLYDENFINNIAIDSDLISKPYFVDILREYSEKFNLDCMQNEWFDGVKTIAEKYNYALKPKDYKNNPDNYNGSIVDVATFIRFALTGKKDSPDIFEISKYLGYEKCKKRLEKLIELSKGM